MTRKKNRFWTFIFSLLPGAGEMYMGFMKQGVTLMGAFFLLIFLASWLNMGQLLFVLPVLWCYGFFHVHNLRAMPDEEFYALEDDYLFHLERILPKEKNMDQKSRNVLATICIVTGAVILWNNLSSLLRLCLPHFLQNWYWKFQRGVPQVVVAILFIVGGIWLIRGKKKELDEQEQRESEVQRSDDMEQKGGEQL